MTQGDFAPRPCGEQLTKAEVLYHMPGRPGLLQRFTWQTLDVSPDYPRVHRFLDFWRQEIEAVIHSVTVSAADGATRARLQVTREARWLH